MTDCPTCGRTIRVPDLEGKIAPLPKPKLDYADTGLARALSELADLGVADAAKAEAGGSPHLPKPEAVVLAAPPVIEAVALPVPLPPEPMQHVGSSEPEAEPASSAPTNAQNSDKLWEPLAELAAMSPAGHHDIAPKKRSTAQLLAAGSVCVFIGLVAGFLIGRKTKGVPEPINPVPAVAPADAGAIVAPPPAILVAEDATSPAIPPPASGRQHAIKGRITYINADGESRPDSGARVLALPAAREGASKLSVDSFRTGAGDADLRVAQASIRALGGDYVFTDSDGRYDIQLSGEGKIHLVIVSKYQGRGSGGENGPAETAVLRDWFDKPQLFLGQTQSTLTTVQLDGQASSALDHVFPKAE